MQRESVDLYISAVTIYRQLGMIDRALEYAARSAEKYPDSPSAVETYLSLLINRGERETAERYIREQQGGDRRNPEIRSLFYYFQARLTENNSEKLQLLQSALLENIRNFSALRDIALLYESLGEYNKALRYLRQALIVRPEDAELQKKLREIEAKRE